MHDRRGGSHLSVCPEAATARETDARAVWLLRASNKASCQLYLNISLSRGNRWSYL